MANFQDLSRYTNFVVEKNRSLVDFLKLREPLNLEPADGDVFITIDSEVKQRPDLLANKVYNNPLLWWVIYEFNDIRDPLFDLKEGTVLRIPEKNRVTEAIKNIGFI